MAHKTFGFVTIPPPIKNNNLKYLISSYNHSAIIKFKFLN